MTDELPEDLSQLTVEEIVDELIRRGEIEPEDRERVIAFLKGADQ